jgi:uncharacterized membrane protein
VTSAAGAVDRAGPLRTTAAFACVLFSGLFAGFLVTVLTLEATLRSFGAAVYTQVRLVELKHLDDLATALLMPALLAAAVLALIVLRRRDRGRWLVLTAVLLLVVTVVISVSISVPINTVQAGWSVASPPSDWSSVRDRWQLAHVVRTSTSALAFALLTAALRLVRFSR